MHFEGSLQEMIIKGMDFKEKFGCHKMEKYGKTIQNKLMMVISEAEKWTKIQNGNNLGEK